MYGGYPMSIADRGQAFLVARWYQERPIFDLAPQNVPVSLPSMEAEPILIRQKMGTIMRMQLL